MIRLGTIDDPREISRYELERLEQKFGWTRKYEDLKEGKTVEIDGIFYKLSFRYNGPSPLRKQQPIS